MNQNVRYTEIGISYSNSRTKKNYKLDKFVEEISYTDCAVGEGDTIEVKLNDHDNKLLYDYYPGTNDMMQCGIYLNNLEGLGRKCVSNESFYVDKIGYSDMPATFSISGITIPKNSKFSKTPKTKTWKYTSVWRIAEKICKDAGIGLFWGAGATDYIVVNEEQSEKTDLSFLYSICQTYGLGMKIFSRYLVIFSEEYYEKKSAVTTIKRNNILDGTFNADFELIRTYTGFEYEYTANNGVEWKESLFFITKPEIVVSVGKCDSKSDGLVKGKAKVNESNKNMQIINFEMLGDQRIIATATFNLSGYGGLDGKYYVNKVTHKFSASSGYTQEVEARKILQRL